MPEEVLAISRKAKINVKTATIAHYFAMLIEKELRTKDIQYDIDVGSVKDPADFIAQIRGAELITKFRFTFRGPNPIDASDVVDPLKRALNKINAEKGAVEFKGDNIDPDDAEVLTREAAATNEKASAKIKAPNEAVAKTRSLGRVGAFASVSVDQANTIAERQTVANEVRARYEEVRTAEKAAKNSNTEGV